MISRLGILFMQLLARLPLGVVRALGAALGVFLYAVVWPRRKVVQVNLALCFPERSPLERKRIAHEVFVRVAQAWLDRSWLWHGDPETTRARMRVIGALHAFDGATPTLIFAQHFVGMDAGWTALTQQVDRRFVGIYANQSNKIVDDWTVQGRHRFGRCRPFGRSAGVRPLIAALRDGEVMYLLPDMNYGPEQSVFVPFYGVPAATVSSLSRFAKLGGAKVVPVITRMVPQGYEIEVLPAWTDFPSADAVADTALMNQRLQGYIDRMPAQYYWVHKRFKSRPPGLPPVY